MAEVAVFGTAAADVVLRVPSVPKPGDHIQAEPLGWRLGGGSANVACALSRAGHEVELIGPVGGDSMAAALLDELARHGVRTDRSIRTGRPSPRALILLDSGGERTIVGLDQGSATDVYPLEDLPVAGPVDCVHVETWLRFPTTIADRSPQALLVANAPSDGDRPWPADILLASESRLPAAWRDRPYESAVEVAGRRLRWIVVTRGGRGADAYGPGSSSHVDAKPANQVDATGAGDAFAAGLISALLGGREIEAALELGAAWAAATVEVLQSFPPDWIGGVDPP